mgnify:CR=1 FL=1
MTQICSWNRMEKKIRLSDLNEKDEIRVVGIGTKILSVSVTTGQGTLELKNTSVFEGSFIQVGSKNFCTDHTQYEAGDPGGNLYGYRCK